MHLKLRSFVKIIEDAIVGEPTHCSVRDTDQEYFGIYFDGYKVFEHQARKVSGLFTDEDIYNVLLYITVEKNLVNVVHKLDKNGNITDNYWQVFNTSEYDESFAGLEKTFGRQFIEKIGINQYLSVDEVCAANLA